MDERLEKARQMSSPEALLDLALASGVEMTIEDV